MEEIPWNCCPRKHWLLLLLIPLTSGTSCWRMMLHSALDSFHPADSITESRHLYLKAKPSQTDRICCLRGIILLWWEVKILAKTWILIPGTIQSPDICALLKFPHPEFTVGGINFYCPTKKHKLNFWHLASVVWLFSPNPALHRRRNVLRCCVLPSLS